MRLSLKSSRGRREPVRYHDIYPKPQPKHRGFRRPLRTRIPITLAILTPLLLVGGFWAQNTLQADSVTLYPTACLGGWLNAERAQGELSPNAADVQSYTISAVATLPADTISEMFCGGFSAEFPPRSTPKSLTLLVAWSTEVGEDPTKPVVTGGDFESSSGEVLDAPPGSDPSFRLIEPVNGGAVEPAPAPEAIPLPVPEPEPEPAPEPAPEPEAPVESSPVSFLKRLISVAQAQEAPDPVPVPEAVLEQSPLIEEIVDPIPVPTGPEPSLELIPDTIPEPVAEPTSPNAFLEVRYTLNGKDWESLGFYDAAHVVPTTFSIPLPENASWSDLTSFQISIRSRATIDGSPEVYLDGMELRIDYAEGVDPFYSDKTLYSTDELITLTSEIPGSFVQIYWLDNPDTAPEPSQVFAGTIGDDGTIQIEVKTLFPGRFEFVNTTTKWHCSNLYLDDCIARGALGSVIIVIGTPEDVAATLASSTAAIASLSPPIEEESKGILDKIIDLLIGDGDTPSQGNGAEVPTPEPPPPPEPVVGDTHTDPTPTPNEQPEEPAEPESSPIESSSESAEPATDVVS